MLDFNSQDQEVADFEYYLQVGAPVLPVLVNRASDFKIVSEVCMNVPLICVDGDYFTEEDYDILLVGQQVYKRIGKTLFDALAENRKEFIGSSLPDFFLYDLRSFLSFFCHGESNTHHLICDIIFRGSGVKVSLDSKVMPDESLIYNLQQTGKCPVEYSSDWKNVYLETDDGSSIVFKGENAGGAENDSAALELYKNHNGYYVGSAITYSKDMTVLSRKIDFFCDCDDLIRFFFNYGHTATRLFECAALWDLSYTEALNGDI